MSRHSIIRALVGGAALTLLAGIASAQTVIKFSHVVADGTPKAKAH